MSTNPVDLVLSHLDGVKQVGEGKWQARCPAHADREPSLSVSTAKSGTVLLHCHAGCKTADVLTAVGLRFADLNAEGPRGAASRIVATYDYRDADGGLLFQVVRLEPKTFRQRRPDGNGGWIWNLNGVEPVLYRLGEIVRATPETRVYVAEGEKDADALSRLGMVATTNPQGAGKWRPAFNEYLRGRLVILIPDNDDPGREHARLVARSLDGIAAEVRVLELAGLPEHGDVSDWLDSGGNPQDLAAMAAAAPLAADWLKQNGEPAASSGVQVSTREPDDPIVPPLHDCPPLPDGAQPDPELGVSAGVWVRLYTGYASDLSPMTPMLFHEGAALWLISVAIARRLKLAMPWGDLHPNLFQLWLAPTTLYRKSTGLDRARHVARKVLWHLMAAQETTPEAFFADLAGREPPLMDKLPQHDRDAWAQRRHFSAQRGWILDEMSGLLASAGRDYGQGLVESLLRFYDCDPLYERSTRGQGLIVVRDSYLSLLGASTPAAMLPHLKSEHLWANGFFPRFAILTPEDERPVWREPIETPEPPELCGWLRELYSRLPVPTWPEPPEARTALLGSGVYAAWNRYNRACSYDLLLSADLDGRLHGTYGRLPAQALKVALGLAAVDGWEGNVPTVEIPHLARAIQITEEWRRSAHRAIRETDLGAFDKFRLRVIRQVGRHEPRGATLRDIYRCMQDRTPAEVEEVVLQLVRVGELEEIDTGERRGGTQIKRYRLGRQ